MNWLGQADHVSLRRMTFFHALAIRWMWNWTQSTTLNDDEAWALAVRFLDYLEANAEDIWHVPALFQDEVVPPGETESEENIFDAAYEGMTFHDSADDDQEGSVLEGSAQAEYSELDAEVDRLGPRLRFLSTSARLWQLAARLNAGAQSTVAGRRCRPGGGSTGSSSSRCSLPRYRAHPSWQLRFLVDYDRRLMKEQYCK